MLRFRYKIERLHCLLLLFLVGCLSTSGLEAQSLSIQAALDRAEMMTGEQAVIDVTIRTSRVEQTKYHLVERIDEQPRFVVLSFGATDTIELGDGSKEIRAKMLITSFDSTLVSIPPIMAVNDADTALTAPMALSVVQPDVDLEHPEDIKDIKPLWEVSYTWRDILVLILSSPFFWAVALLVLLSYIMYRYRQYQKAKSSEPDPFVVSQEPCLTAMAELEQQLSLLECGVYHSQEDYKGLYSKLIEALKAYLHKAEGWAWQELTSSEIRDFLNLANVPVDVKRDINALLMQADMSKFAKGLPSEADARASIRATRGVARALEGRHQDQETISRQYKV